MRADHSEPDAMFSYVSPAQRVPKDHPLPAIRTLGKKTASAPRGREATPGTSWRSGASAGWSASNLFQNKFAQASNGKTGIAPVPLARSR